MPERVCISTVPTPSPLVSRGASDTNKTDNNAESSTIAVSAFKTAHAPYSQFNQGAAITYTLGGVTATKACGSLENCAYPNSICALKAAVVSCMPELIASSRNHEMVTVDSFELVYPENFPGPCGCCLSFASEFCAPSTPINISFLGHDDKVVRRECSTLGHLLPTFHDHATQFKSGAPTHTHTLPNSGKLFMSEETLSRVADKEGFMARFGVDNGVESSDELRDLCLDAVRASLNCYVPVSSFPVGAALIARYANGQCEKVAGGNVESTYYTGHGLCGERSTLCRALRRATEQGTKLIGVKALAVTCLILAEPGRPCGGCRQNLVEWGKFPVFQLQVLPSGEVIIDETTSYGLLPNCFSPAALE